MARAMAKVRKHKPSKKVLFIIVAVLLLVAAGSFGLWRWRHHSNKPTVPPPPANTSGDGSTINFGPATAQERQEAEDHKKALEQQQAQVNQNTGGSRVVSPVIVSAAQSGDEVHVSGFVSGVFENGGTCTLELSKTGQPTITKTTTGVQNATNTLCPQFTVERSEFTASGIWTASLSYSSNTAHGTSQPTNFGVN